MKAPEEFKEGKHSIGYVGSDFIKYFSHTEFEKVEKIGSVQRLSTRMTDAEIESGLKPGLCTLGDVLAMMQSDTPESKDGNWNLFYFEQCVVSVRWYSGDRYWNVYAWRRDDRGWRAGGRVFSPASDQGTQTSPPQTWTLESLNSRIERLEALINPELLK